MNRPVTGPRSLDTAGAVPVLLPDAGAAGPCFADAPDDRFGPASRDDVPFDDLEPAPPVHAPSRPPPCPDEDALVRSVYGWPDDDDRDPAAA